MTDVSIYMAFAAGLISFLSPCVLPLVPEYASFISGVTFAELGDKTEITSWFSKERRIILFNSILSKIAGVVINSKQTIL